VSQAIQLAAAMADKRISTARLYPRSIATFKRRAMDALSEDIETARSAEYAKPQGGGFVRGPSIRLAELAAMFWGNLEVEVAEPVVSDRSVSVTASAYDLQNNYRQESLATVSIIGKTGQRFPGHLIETLILATAAKAKRNAILAVIPRSYVNDLLEHAKGVATKNAPSLEETRGKMIEMFARKYKVSADQLCTLVDVRGIDDMASEHLDTIRGVWTALSEGGTVSEFFAPQESKADAVRAQVAGRQAAKAEAAVKVKPAEAKAPVAGGNNDVPA
jgi:hypothetical protein